MLGLKRKNPYCVVILWTQSQAKTNFVNTCATPAIFDPYNVILKYIRINPYFSQNYHVFQNSWCALVKNRILGSTSELSLEIRVRGVYHPPSHLNNHFEIKVGMWQLSNGRPKVDCKLLQAPARVGRLNFEIGFLYNLYNNKCI